MPTRKLNFSISPLNDNPVKVSGATLANGFSHKNGFPTIKWSIPAQNMMLDTNSLYLSGQIVVKNAAGDLQQLGNTTAEADKYNVNNGGTLDACAATNWSNWNGVSSTIDKVVIQSKKTQTELQSILNYSMFNALKKGYSYNPDDYKQTPLSRDLAAGTNHDVVCRHLVNGGNPAGCNIESVDDKYYGQFFSIKLDVALLENIPLHLGNDYLGGLLLTIHLNPDASFFHSRHRNFITGSQPSADPTGASYTLKNLKLEGKYLVPSPQDLKAYPSQVALSSRVNLLNELVSSNNANTYTPQVQMVKGIVSTFLDDDQQNNYLRCTNNFREPVGLIEYEQAKNNIKYPYDFQTKMVPNHQSATEAAPEQSDQGNQAGVFAAQGMAHPATAHGDSEIRLQFMRSVTGGIIPRHNSASLSLTNTNLTEDYAGAASGADSAGLNTFPDILGIGADFSNSIGQVQNFVNQDYELKVTSGVNTGRASLPTYRSSKAEVQETFIRNTTAFNLQTLQSQA